MPVLAGLPFCWRPGFLPQSFPCFSPFFLSDVLQSASRSPADSSALFSPVSQSRHMAAATSKLTMQFCPYHKNRAILRLTPLMTILIQHQPLILKF